MPDQRAGDMTNGEAMTEGRKVPERLYGLRDSEQYHDDPASVYESEIEPFVDEHDRRPWEIEEWTVRRPIDLVPRADWMLEWMAEHIADELCDEYGYVDASMKHPEVVAAAEALRESIAAHTTYFQCDQLVAKHTLSWDDQGEPLYDGEPMYRKAPA